MGVALPRLAVMHEQQLNPVIKPVTLRNRVRISFMGYVSYIKKNSDFHTVIQTFEKKRKNKYELRINGIQQGCNQNQPLSELRKCETFYTLQCQCLLRLLVIVCYLIHSIINCSCFWFSRLVKNKNNSQLGS